MGGENRVKGVAAVQLRGSSPRGRGKRLIPRSRQTWDRLIPAWAGKTSKRTRRSLTFSAHPRVGGENQAAPGDEGPPAGSSPRGRGKRARPRVRSCRLRLIPAWAGKTATPRSNGPGGGAHPRVGGENSCSVSQHCRLLGSSPRGRGKRDDLTRRDSPGRLIPAWAGKTWARAPNTPQSRAHPRVGGENPRPAARPSASPGSSPRRRGKPVHHDGAQEEGRLIPA